MSTFNFPGFDKFYVLSGTGSSTEFIADIDLSGKSPVAVVRGDTNIGNVCAKWAMGSDVPEEVIFTQLAIPILLSPIMVGVFSNENVSGWKTYSVRLRGKLNEDLGKYFGLIVKGRCGPVDMGLCKTEMKSYPSGKFPVLRGLYFKENSWDGSDIFMPNDNTGWIIVTERVKKLILGLTKAAKFIALTDVEHIT